MGVFDSMAYDHDLAPQCAGRWLIPLVPDTTTLKLWHLLKIVAIFLNSSVSHD